MMWPIKASATQNERPSVRRVIGTSRWMAWIAPVAIFIIVALVLARRPLYTAADDLEYLSYFSGTSATLVDSLWSTVIEEPLWIWYSASLGGVLGPELALRVTIFIATMGLLLAATKLARGAWVFVLLAFLLDASMATLFYYIQVRNGLALSLFLTVIAFAGNSLVAAAVASSVHTSFLVGVPCSVLTHLTGKSKLAFAAGVALTAVGVVVVGQQLQQLHLGRRTGTYEWGSTSNANFYLVALVQYAIMLWGVWPSRRDEHINRLLRYTTIFFVTALSLTFVHEAAVRLVFVSRMLLVVSLGASMKTPRAKVAGAVWIGLLVLLVLLDSLAMEMSPDAWLARWEAILAK